MFSTKKFKREIEALRAAEAQEAGLHPLRLAQLKAELLKQLTLPADSAVGLGRLLAHVRQPRPLFMRYVVPTVLSVSLVGTAVLASGSALPGSPLYPVKRLKENVVLGLTVSPQAHAEVRADQARERLSELTQVEPAVVVETPTLPVTATADITNVPAILPPVPPPPVAHNHDDARFVAAQAEATAEVDGALANLAQVRADLEAKGNLNAAGEIGRNLKRLQAEATAHRVKFKFKDSEDTTTDSSGEQQTTPAATDGSANSSGDQGHQGQGQRSD